MMMFTEFAIFAAVCWLGLLVFRHGFWRADQRLEGQRLEEAPPFVAVWPDVVAVIPARNEAAVIGTTLRSLLAQEYAGAFHIVVVDDGSDDGTAAVVAATTNALGVSDRVTLVPGAPLPAGWTGKTWAMAQGVRAAGATAPLAAYILFTDADIVYEPQVLSRLVAKAIAERRDLVSVMAWLRCQEPWERLLIPAFVFFFQKLYPFRAVNDPYSPVAAAAGGCMLVRRQALSGCGGIEAIRDRVIDDCALGQQMKGSGSIWLGLSEAVRSLREYEDLDDIWRMVARTAFVQLDHKVVFLFGTVAAMTLLYLVPPAAALVGILSGRGGLLFAGALGMGMMTAAYRPTTAFYRLSWPAALTLPAAAVLFTLMTVDSARLTWLGRGGAWKGRVYGSGAEAGNEIRQFVARSGSSFLWAMRFLSAQRRDGMFAIYAFCRKVDDVADEDTLAVPGGENDATALKLAALDEWRYEVDRIFEGRSGDPLGKALSDTVTTFALRREDFMAVIDGMEMDAREEMRAPTLAKLDLYCDRVASAVGRLSSRVFGLPVVEGDLLAHELGRALQLTNILRDVDEDAARGRLYLPKELLERHGVPLEPGAVPHHPRLPRVCAELATIAQGHFAAAEIVLRRCDASRRRPAVIMMAVYRKLLERVVQNGWRPGSRVVKLSKAEKILIALRHAVF
ncbi:MAG: presqualene diphosphate synthase HpnD [Alphaproteobacteria bacterium]|nr:presqualene diphosphate synthase HpnD [Alphaproteobacteria bacterium]